MNKTKRDQAIEAAVDIFKDRIDVDCKHGSGFFKEYVNKDGSVERRPFGCIVGKYWHVSIDGMAVQAHRLRWTIANGVITKGMVINHIDNNPSNNSIENLEMVSRSKNSMNRLISDRNKSGVPGVALKYNKWSVQISSNLLNSRKKLRNKKSNYNCVGVRKRYNKYCAYIRMFEYGVFLGTYLTRDEAILVRDRAYALRLLEDPVIKNKEHVVNLINRCKNKLHLSENDIEILKNHMTGLNNKDLSVL